MKKIEKGILGIVITGAVISLMVAVFIYPFASSFHDGLEKVADTLGFADRASAFADDGFFLIPDYLFKYT